MIRRPPRSTRFPYATPFRSLLGAATLGQRRHRANGLGVRLLLEDRLEVPVQATELGSQGLLRGRASQAPATELGRLDRYFESRSEDHKAELQSRLHLRFRLL